MSHIIVGFDGSSAAASALVWAAERARLTGTDLKVITVDDTPGRTDTGDAIIYNRLHPEVEHIAVETDHIHTVEHGDTAATLVDACSAEDLLVVGSRGRGQLSERLLGSVSHACLHAAPCSVVVVHKRSLEDRGAVLVAVDGSESSRRALELAAAEAKLRGLHLRVAHAVRWDHIGVEVVLPTEEDLVTWGHQLVEKELAEVGVDAEILVSVGSPGEVLTEESKRADLLVMGARGHSPLAALLLGSTADHCVREAHCPVMLVRA